MQIYWSFSTINKEPINVYPSLDRKEIVIGQGDMFIQLSLKDAGELATKIGFTLQDEDLTSK